MASSPISRFRNGTVTTFINPSTLGDTLLVPAPGAGIKIRVTSLVMTTTLVNVMSFKSGSTAITPPFRVAASTNLILDQNPDGWFTTNANEALNFNMTVSTDVAVMVNYQLTQV